MRPPTILRSQRATGRLSHMGVLLLACASPCATSVSGQQPGTRLEAKAAVSGSRRRAPGNARSHHLGSLRSRNGVVAAPACTATPLGVAVRLTTYRIPRKHSGHATSGRSRREPWPPPAHTAPHPSRAGVATEHLAGLRVSVRPVRPSQGR